MFAQAAPSLRPLSYMSLANIPQDSRGWTDLGSNTRCIVEIDIAGQDGSKIR